ncbi:hypothetical protein AMJ86_06240 [bacterium SM23_57]|nr:MAG: hypothetical protein AMJ86_06240 [bacterium SM23_57]
MQFEELTSLGLARPEGREARFRAGVVRLKDLGDPTGAKVDFQILLSSGLTRIGDQEVGLWLGDCYVMEGDLDSAQQSYVRAISRQRGQRDVIPAILNMRLARVALWFGEFQRAADLLDQVVKGKPDDETVNNALIWSMFLSAARRDSAALAIFASGDMLSFKGEHEQALVKFQEAREIAPKGRVAQESLFRLALELRAMGQASAAVDSLKGFLELYPSSTQRDDAMFLVGDILEKDLRDIPAAIEQYEELLIESPGGMHMEESRRRIRELEAFRQT